MNSKRIEEIAVHYVETIVLENPYLGKYLSTNDKEPSWDGNIYVYKDVSGSKESILGRVPVQIKGSTSFDMNNKTYPIQVVDLKNYLDDGGVIYIVVAIENEIKTVFYKQLLPTDIKRLLYGKEAQKTISTKLNLLPLDNAAVLAIFKDFLKAKPKEMSYSSLNIENQSQIFETSIQNGGEVTFEFSGKSLLDVFDKNERKELRLYTQSSSNPIPIPSVEEIKNLTVYEELDTEVKVNGITFYNSVIRERTDVHEVIIHFGKSYKFKVVDNNEANLNFKMTKVLSDVEKDYKFFSLFIKYNTFEIFGDSINFSYQTNDSNLLSQVDDEYSKLSNVIKLWNKLNLNLEFDLEKLSGIQQYNLLLVSDSVINKIPLQMKKIQKRGMYILDCGSIDLIFYAVLTSEGYIFYDFFDIDELQSKEDDWQRIIDFCKINLKIMTNLANIDLKKIFYISKRYHKIQPIEGIEYVLLKAIGYSDQLKDEDVKDRTLEVCLEFAKWLYEEIETEDNEYSMLLNILQIKYRQKKLNSEDYQQLVQILSNNLLDSKYKFGAAVLLDKKVLADKYLETIEQDYVHELKELPIYEIYTKLTNTLLK